MTSKDETISVNVRINPSKASKRTRNRVKEGGPEFAMFHLNTNRAGSVLLRSPKTGWFGWLPKDEVFIEQKVTSDAG